MTNAKPPPKQRRSAKTPTVNAGKVALKLADSGPQPGLTHRQRFDQLLDDVVFGKPTKR